MNISGTFAFNATPDEVWAAIYDPATLKASIPQCDEITLQRPDFWLGRASVKIGTFSVHFDGTVTLTDITPPEHYTIHIAAKGWVGKADGSAHVILTPQESGTQLTYSAEVHIGIKLLDKAMNMAHGVARDLADKFFARLAIEIERRRQPQV